jgi:hypothetical protein
MHACVSYGHADVLRLLLSHGGDVHVRDEDGAWAGAVLAAAGVRQTHPLPTPLIRRTHTHKPPVAGLRCAAAA